jgi:hypothetical protein
MTIAPEILRFLTHEERVDRVQPLEYRVMVFTPRGMYPRGTCHVPNGFFHADEEMAFSVVLGESWRTYDPEVPFSEFDWASPQELRLIASLILCEVMDGVYIRLYPLVRFGPWLNASDLDLSSRETVNQVRDLLMRHASQPQSIRNEWSSLAACRTEYNLWEPKEFALDRQREFWHALATPNYVLVRGVYALMKSAMLSCHYEFSEEAVHALYIALDASFALVIRQLKKQGITNPTAHDAQVWVHQHFNAAFGLAAPEAADKYFGEFYEQRVMTFHPASRHGDMPFSPNMHDDIVHLRRWLREVFGFLLVGRHDPGYEDALRKHFERQPPPSGSASGA